ncbi:EKC/KEOPS complex subunit Tprkb-like [Acanthaster planci]|uniref:EKC/KEOPS complex subunit Tprkb-like n=1 Tax=Acanthaster planci TaxID=133434 RepID=A0A8B7XLG8_ACAPL|nr:EKC/KEOPS complex subunit Tprkb-like [Acanthaster planci]
MLTPDFAVKFQLELFPETEVCIALFKDVKNVDEIKNIIMAGEIDAALLSPKMIIDPFQVLIAANKTLHVKKHGLKMQTRNINSEVLFNLSPTNNISASFKRFGLTQEDTGLLAVTLDDASLDKMLAVESSVDGCAVSLDDLASFTDESLIKQVYKIQEEELRVCSVLDAVVSRMSGKEML